MSTRTSANIAGIAASILRDNTARAILRNLSEIHQNFVRVSAGLLSRLKRTVVRDHPGESNSFELPGDGEPDDLVVQAR